MKILIVLVSLFSFLEAHAFTMNNSARLTFAQDEVKVNVAAGLCNNIGINDEELLSIVESAVNEFWNQTPTSRLKLRKGSAITVDAAFRTANICSGTSNCNPNPTLAVSNDILISCNVNTTIFSSSSILAVTLPNNISGATIVGSLVLVNDRADNRFAGKSRAEKVAIIAHELGHAFGLGHSPVEYSLMYFATMEHTLNLGRDDMDGMSYLYPKQQPIKGCGTIDLNGGDRPNWWSGLFIGFSIIGLSEIVRKRKSKICT
jgi:hypothetical protein